VTSERGSASEPERVSPCCCCPVCTRLSLTFTRLVGQLPPGAEALQLALRAPESSRNGCVRGAVLGFHAAGRVPWINARAQRVASFLGT